MDKSENVLLSLEEGNYLVTLHARRRMAERNITYSDIQSCGRTGKAVGTVEGKFEVTGRDCDGEQLTVICVEENGVLIITVF